MTLIDWILNVTGVLLWLNFRSVKFDPLVRTSAASLAGTLRRAEPVARSKWPFLAAVVGVILFRGWFYSELGPAVDWVPSLRLGAITIPFRSDYKDRVLLFSILSFCLSLSVFYLWILCLSLVNGRASETDPLQRFVRLHLGVVDGWPWLLRLLLPLIAGGVVWFALHPVFTGLGVVPHAGSMRVLLGQTCVMGLASYLSWKYVLGGLLALYLLNSYVYLGSHPFWAFVTLTGGNILGPLRKVPLCYGKVDFSPVLAIFMIFGVSQLIQAGLVHLYRLASA
jgi:uncharacterized protein YggT (Ycf19 family)